MKLSSLRIIGEKREKDFNKLGVFDGDDLIRFYPRADLDLPERSSLRTADHNARGMRSGAGRARQLHEPLKDRQGVL